MEDDKANEANVEEKEVSMASMEAASDKPEDVGAEPRRKGFESGSPKIYMAIKMLLYGQSGSVLQVGAVNSRTGEELHLQYPLPAHILQATSASFLDRLNLRENTIQSEHGKDTESEGTAAQSAHGEMVTKILEFIQPKAKEKDCPVTLVFYSHAEYAQMVIALREASHQSNAISEAFTRLIGDLVEDVVVYEKYMRLTNRPFRPIDRHLANSQDLQLPENVDSALTQAGLLRKLFESDRRPPSYFKVFAFGKEVTSKDININPFASESESDGAALTRFLLISAIHVDTSRSAWFQDKDAIKKISTERIVQLPDGDPECVSVFTTSVFPFAQPVFVKLRSLASEEEKKVDSVFHYSTANSVDKENATSSEEDLYRAEGKSPIYTYNSVQFSVAIIKPTKDILQPLSESGLEQQSSHEPSKDVDETSASSKLRMKFLLANRSFLNFKCQPASTSSTSSGQSSPSAAMKFDLILEKSASVTPGSRVSVLVRLKAVGAEGAASTVRHTLENVFYLTPSSLKLKSLKVYNPLFCLAKLSEENHEKDKDKEDSCVGLARLVVAIPPPEPSANATKADVTTNRADVAKRIEEAMTVTTPSAAAPQHQLSHGSCIGQATLLTQETLPEALVQVFLHETDILPLTGQYTNNSIARKRTRTNPRRKGSKRGKYEADVYEDVSEDDDEPVLEKAEDVLGGSSMVRQRRREEAINAKQSRRPSRRDDYSHQRGSMSGRSSAGARDGSSWGRESYDGGVERRYADYNRHEDRYQQRYSEQNKSRPQLYRPVDELGFRRGEYRPDGEGEDHGDLDHVFGTVGYRRRKRQPESGGGGREYFNDDISYH